MRTTTRMATCRVGATLSGPGSRRWGLSLGVFSLGRGGLWGFAERATQRSQLKSGDYSDSADAIL